jgi:hypothetical protein
LKMWWEIWGLSLPVAILSLGWWPKLPRISQLFLGSFWLIFMLANIVLFQPVQWDNSKLFVWVYLGLCAMMALFLQRLTKLPRVHSIIKSGLVFSLFVALSFSGFLELVRLHQFDKNTLMMSPKEDILLGDFLRHKTDSQAIFLTNTSHNHPVMMWGVRPILMGYPTWVWNFGFQFHERQTDIATMYAGNSQSLALLKEYQVDYVVVGVGEIFDQRANENFFNTRFPLLIATQNYRIYDVRSLKNK